MILKAIDLDIGFGAEELIQGASFQIDEGNRIALIGPNGSGKTTLLKVILGQQMPVNGQLIVRNRLQIGYQRQFRTDDPHRSLWAEYEREFEDIHRQITVDTQEDGAKIWDLASEIDHEMLSYEKRIRSILKGLGFDEDDWARSLKTFSGGELTRISLGKVFLKEYDFLILDEPTNHLDIPSVIWLEGILSNYHGSILMVSHDRDLVDRVANRVYEINQRQVYVFNTSYQDYLLQRERMNETLARRQKNLSKEIDRQQRLVEQFKTWGHRNEKFIKQARSREKVVDRLIEEADQIQIMDEETSRLGQIPSVDRSDYLLIHAEGLGKRYGSNKVFEHVCFDLHRDEKAVLLGKNGIGKTTLLKIITGQERPDTGHIALGPKTRVGYLSQNLEELDESKEVLEQIWSLRRDWPDYEIRKYAGRFGFIGEDVFKPISVLSGGEKLKLSLATLFLKSFNFLVLDEPTNHLDLPSIDRLQSVLEEYQGALLMVTHDRRLLRKVSNRLFLLHRKGIEEIPSLDRYLERMNNSFRFKEGSRKKSRNQVTFQQQKNLKNRLKAIHQEVERIETKFSEYEQRQKEITDRLYATTDYQKAQELQGILQEVDQEMNALLSRMERLEADQISLQGMEEGDYGREEEG